MKKNIALLALSLIANLTAPSAFAAMAVYNCSAVDQTAGTVTLTIGNAHFVKVDDSVAELDQNYEPSLNAGYVRFEYQQNFEGTNEVLVQERLLKGSRTGFIKLQNRGEGFGSDKYACTAQN